MSSPSYPEGWPQAVPGSPLHTVYQALFDAGSAYSSGQDFTCPAHEDGKASLGVSAGRKVPVVFSCQAGCETVDIVEALGLSPADVGMGKANPASTGRGTSQGGARTGQPGKATTPAQNNASALCARTMADHARDDVPARTRKWTYTAADGSPTVVVRRRDYECPDPSHRKHIDQLKVNGVAPKDAPYDLYRLPEVDKAVAEGKVVLLVEGEPSVDAAVRAGERGFIATTARGGAGKGKWRPEYAQRLVGAKRVVVVADRDDVGLAHAQAAAASLDELGVPWEVRTSLTLGAHDDLVEHLAAGHRVRDLVVLSSSTDGPPDRGALPWPSPVEPLEVAHRLVELDHSDDQGARLRLFWRGDFYDWAGPHWSTVDEKAVRAEVYARLRTARFSKSGGDLIAWMPDQGKVTKVIDALTAVCYRPNVAVKPDVVSFSNGLLDLSSRRLSPHSPEVFNLVSLPFAFSESAPEPARWLRFLRSLWSDDVESIALLQEVFGYLVSGRTDFQKIAMLIGPTRSGKGTIARVLSALMGRENVCSPTLSSLSGDFGLQPLIGKSVALVSDARFTGKDQGVVVERLLSVSGEDSLSINRKNTMAWEGSLSTRFVIMSNESPSLRDSSGALAHRMVLLRMTRSFLGKEDFRLAADLVDELPGILLWALAGYDRLVAQGRFTTPKASVEIERELLRLTSPVTAFVEDVCVLDPKAVVAKSDLWAEWRAWAQGNGQFEGSAETFGRNMVNAFTSRVKAGRSRDANDWHQRTHVYRGIKVRSDRD